MTESEEMGKVTSCLARKSKTSPKAATSELNDGGCLGRIMERAASWYGSPATLYAIHTAAARFDAPSILHQWKKKMFSFAVIVRCHLASSKVMVVVYFEG